jgi:hypothetical protein
MTEERKTSHAQAGVHSPALHHFVQRGVELHFQDGPIGEHGVNGTTNEEVIQILIDRLHSLQAMGYACKENACAITHLEEALHWLQARTAARVARGVEGTSTP